MNRTLSILMAVALVCALLLSACGSAKTPAPTAAGETAKETAAAPETAGRELSLTDWSFTASTWSSPDGATVNLTAVPSAHSAKDSATLLVRLDGEEIVAIPCDWKDDAYVVSADLNAADGYCYYMLLTGEDGVSAEIAVNTPDAPTEESVINLASSLESYCSLTLGATTLIDGKLTISEGVALVQAPRITNEGSGIACAQATLVLTLDDQEIDSMALTMAPGEESKSYEASLAGLSFSVPENMGMDQRLVLRLDAELTNGQELTAQGVSWYYQDGAIATAVG